VVVAHVGLLQECRYMYLWYAFLSVQYLRHPVSVGFSSNQLKPNFITEIMHFTIPIQFSVLQNLTHDCDI
jgi:hypothetical protein